MFKSVALALVCASCVVPLSTGVVVARLDSASQSMTVCEVAFGWSLTELIEHCGQPSRVVSNATNQDEACAIYRNDAKSFAYGQGANAVAVCVGRGGFSKHSKGQVKRGQEPLSVAGASFDDAGSWRVIHVVGLDYKE